MKVKYALMLCVFSLAPFSNAQEPAKSTEILAALSTPIPSSVLTLEQRTDKLGSLALVPAETSACLAVLGFGQILVDIENACTVADRDNDSRERRLQSQQETKGFKELIIAGDAELPAMIADIAPLLSSCDAYMNRKFALGLLATFFAVEGIDEGKIMEPTQLAMLKGLSSWLHKETFAPALVIMRIDKTVSDMVKANVARMITDISDDSIIKRHQLTYQGIEFSGFVLDGKALLESEREGISREFLSLGMHAAELEILLKGIEKINWHVLAGFKDDKMIVSISQDPAKQLKLATSPKESILATDRLAFTDHVAAPSVLGYSDVPTSKALLSLKEQMSKAMLEAWARSLEVLAQEWNLGDVAGLVSALNAYDRHYQDLLKMSKLTKPMTFLAWRDKGLQIEASLAKQGLLAMDKPLKLSSFADRPENILYAAASLNPQYVATFIELCESGVEALWQLAPIIVANNKDKKSSEALQMFTLLQMCKPELVQIWNSAKLALSGMDNDAVLIVDKNGSMPKGIPSLSLATGAQIFVPRFAYAKGITNRGKISEAWEKMVTSIDSLVGSLSSPSEVADNADFSLTPKKKDANGLTTYSYPSPFFTVDCDPCLSISDKVFVVGSSPQLNQEVAEAMTSSQSGSFKGAAFVFKTNALVKMLCVTPLLSICIEPEFVEPFLGISEHIDGIYGVVTEDESTNIRISIPFK